MEVGPFEAIYCIRRWDLPRSYLLQEALVFLGGSTSPGDGLQGGFPIIHDEKDPHMPHAP